MNIFRTFYKKFKFAIAILFLFTLTFTSCARSTHVQNQALGYIEKQLSFGYRIPGSQASRDTSLFIRDVLENNGWNVTFQDFEFDNVPIHNVIASQNDSPPDVILGAHYDTRQISDQESTAEKKMTPVPGANDGASGTALLLELSGQLKSRDKNVWLVFFDAEDQGHINSWTWSLGAEYFANHLPAIPKAVIIVDMIGDKDLNIYKEVNSDQELNDEIWSTADELGYKNIFIDQPKYAMIDDHSPFLDKGIPSALLIDFDYPYWHTNEDTIDKVSGESLKIVGDVLLKWLSETH